MSNLNQFINVGANSANIAGDITSVVNVSASGDVDANNALVDGVVSAGGNVVTSSYFIGDGSQLSGVTATANTGNITFANTTISSSIDTANINVTINTGNAVDYQYNFMSVANDIPQYGYVGLEWTDNVTATFAEVNSGTDGNTHYMWLDYNGAHISTSDFNGNTSTWDFGTSGGTSFPGPINATSAPIGNPNFLGETQFNGNVAFQIPGSGLTVATRIPFLAYGNGQIGGSANLAFTAASNTFSTYNLSAGGNIIANGTAIIAGNLTLTAGNINTGDGNVTANYFYGDGGHLSNITVSGGTEIVNGTTSVATILNGNATVTTAGTYSWQFGADSHFTLPVSGNLNLAAGGLVQSVQNYNLDITASDTSDNDNGIVNTIDDGSGVVRTQTKLNASTFTIRTDITGTERSWSFDTGGTLNLPGNIQGVYAGNTSLYAYDDSATGSVELKTISYAGDTLLSNVRSSANAVSISTANATNNWTFDNTGNLNFTHGTQIQEVQSPVPGNYAVAIRGTGAVDPDQQLLVYPTSLDANHLHLTSGDLYNTELFLGNDNLYVKLANTGNVVINSDNGIGNTAQWTFGANGNLSVGGNIIMPPFSMLTGAGGSPAPSINGFDTISAITVSSTGNIVASGIVSVAGNIVGGNINTIGNVTATGNVYGSYIIGNVVSTPTYGQFYDTTTQVNSNVGNAIAMTFNTTDISNGVSVVANSQVTISKAGTYNIQFSAQVDRTSSGTDNVYIWLSKNGTSVVDSSGKVVVTGGASANPVIAAWNWLVESDGNDYFEVMWGSADANIELQAVPTPPIGPAIPSIIVTVVPVGA